MLNRDTILAALGGLSERLKLRGVVGEVNLLGGTAMIFGFQSRQSTKDVHAIFAPATIVSEEARAVAREMGLPEDWLNDAAKGFVSPHGEFRALKDIDFQYLRVQVPTAEYMLAMKVMAARVGLEGTSADKEDIRYLLRWLKLSTAEQVFEIVQRYYDPSRMLVKSMYLVEEIVSEESENGKE